MNSIQQGLVASVVAACAGVVLAGAQSAAPTSTQPVIRELPFGNRVTVSMAGGQQVVQLPFGSVLFDAIWKVSTIPVCWENPDRAEPRLRDLVRDAVLGSWQKESRLQFTGWNTCGDASRGIRVSISDEGPHVTALGRYLDGKPNGMVLNFTFDNWSQSCRTNRDFCVWVIAVHEFGHAIGFAHEQNRQDAPPECRAERQGTDGNWNLTSYDPLSVMNYCNARWNNDGHLSARDIEAVRTIYGTP